MMPHENEPADTHADIAALSQKVDALTIIITCPLWPKRDMLSDEGKALYDRVLSDAKPYALLVARENYLEAMTIAASWSPLAMAYMERTHVNHPNAMVRLANRRLLAVYRHYADAIGVKWSRVN